MSDDSHASPVEGARVFVDLGNSITIVVPVTQKSTVLDLHKAALHRARGLGDFEDLSDTRLQTIGSKPVTLSHEDTVYEVLDLTDDNTFRLRSVKPTDLPADLVVADAVPQAENGTQLACDSTDDGHVVLPEISSTQIDQKACTPPANLDAAAVKQKLFVRWITLEAAMTAQRLRNLPVDTEPIDLEASLGEFHRIAISRLCNKGPQGLCLNPTSLKLYLHHGPLRRENDAVILKELGVVGSLDCPLDIFVEFLGPEERGSLGDLSQSSNPRSKWGFDTSQRGFATLVTSTRMLVKAIKKGQTSLADVLEALLHITHFPPVLLAFTSIYETEALSSVSNYLLIASALHELCKNAVTSEFAAINQSPLEASRQLIAWLFRQTRGPASSIDNERQLVFQAHLFQQKSDEGKKFHWLKSRFENSHVFKAPMANSAAQREVTISTESDENPLFCKLLLLSLYTGRVESFENYFRPSVEWELVLTHHRKAGPEPNAFDKQLDMTNLPGPFRMVSPLNLSQCLAADLPVTTISADGWVSIYDQEDYNCGDRRFIMWNALEGNVIMKDTNPGQYLSQKLDPIIKERKREGSWKVDAWATSEGTEDFGTPEEAIVICVDQSYSMNLAMPPSWMSGQKFDGPAPSRLTEVVEFFKNFALRTSACNLPAHLGLVTFSDSEKVNIMQPLTPLHLNFHQKLNDIKPNGQTAIFDALEKAADMLIEHKKRFKETKRRIILLTDGQDNDSFSDDMLVAKKLHQNGIVLDAIIIGTDSTRPLFKIVKNTGGYAFKPATQEIFFQIFLLETFIDIRMRPANYAFSRNMNFYYPEWRAYIPAKALMTDPYDFPPCKPHPNLTDYFISLSDASKFFAKALQGQAKSSASVRSESTTSEAVSATTGTTIGAVGNSRIILSEVKLMIDNSHEFIDVYVSESNVGFWKVIVQGPPDSAYSRGAFLLYLELGSEFPRVPPSARFITPVLHPNITKHGRICHPIFDREWNPSMHAYQVLQQIYGIFMSIEPRDVIDPLATLKFWTDPEAGREQVASYVERFAFRSREWLKRLIVADDDVSSTTLSTPVSSSASSVTSSSSQSSDRTLRSSGPPSYRSRLSALISPGSSTVGSATPPSTGSTLSNFLSSRRRPPPISGQPEGQAIPSEQASHNRRGSRRANFFNKIKTVKE